MSTKHFLNGRTLKSRVLIQLYLDQDLLRSLDDLDLHLLLLDPLLRLRRLVEMVKNFFFHYSSGKVS